MSIGWDKFDKRLLFYYNLIMPLNRSLKTDYQPKFGHFGRDNPNYGKPRSEEVKVKIGEGVLKNWVKRRKEGKDKWTPQQRKRMMRWLKSHPDHNKKMNLLSHQSEAWLKSRRATKIRGSSHWNWQGGKTIKNCR